MKDDEMVAHYARAGDGSSVIRIGEFAEGVVVALPRVRILGTTQRPAASEPELETHSAVAGR
jgi:hypothetical protein